MRGLTVRWSLADASDDVLETLATYVADTSHTRFTGMPGLAHKTWRAVPGQLSTKAVMRSCIVCLMVRVRNLPLPTGLNASGFFASTQTILLAAAKSRRCSNAS